MYDFARFKDTNKTYRKVKAIAEEQVNKFWSQALKEPDKKMVLSIVLSSVVEALRQQPERYDIIFGNDNDYTSNEKQDAVLEVSNRLSKALIERLVNQTMATLESEDTESDVEETESTKTEVASEHMQATEEEDTKPEEE